MTQPPPRDLLVLSADAAIEAGLKGLLSRHQSLGVRPVEVDYATHPERDPGCMRADMFLRAFSRRYAHALVVFDREGSGRESQSREELERNVETLLSQSGWDNRAAAVAIDPELEIWIWSDSPHVEVCLGWRDRDTRLREWMISRGFLDEGCIKPVQPKEAMQAALREVHKPRSSAIYQDLSQTVGLDRCSDPAFLKLKQVLRTWFPVA